MSWSATSGFPELATVTGPTGQLSGSRVAREEHRKLVLFRGEVHGRTVVARVSSRIELTAAENAYRFGMHLGIMRV